MNESPKILVADDDADIMNLICIRMERAGYDCIRTSDGEEALAAIAQRVPDLCILDVVMPKASGYDVLEALKKESRTDHVPVILLTATIQERDRGRGFELGADVYLTKPFNPRELERAVETLLESS